VLFLYSVILIYLLLYCLRVGTCLKIVPTFLLTCHLYRLEAVRYQIGSSGHRRRQDRGYFLRRSNCDLWIGFILPQWRQCECATVIVEAKSEVSDEFRHASVLDASSSETYSWYPFSLNRRKMDRGRRKL